MKTGLARKYANSESTEMEPAEEIKLLTQVAELRSDVRHLQSDVVDIKTEQRERFDKVEQRFKDSETKSDKDFKAVDARLNEIIGMIASAKLWAYGLYAALTLTLLYVIARSAKWF